MATARQRSGIRGLNKLRRTLRRIEPESTKEVREAIEEGAQAIRSDALLAVPKDEGDLAASIQYKLGRDGLTAVVGPGARAAELARSRFGSPFNTRGLAPGQPRLSTRNQRLLFQFFKGHWIEFGTKGSPEHNIPPQPARPFMGPAFDMNKKWIEGRLARGIDLALRRAATGAAPDD